MRRNHYSTVTAKAANDYEKTSRQAKEDVEDLASIASDYLDDTKKAARALADGAASSVRHAADGASETFSDLSHAARITAVQGFDSISREVARSPFKSLAIAAGIGLLFGLMSRSR